MCRARYLRPGLLTRHSWNYEVGYKGDWMAHTLRTNVAFFYEAIRDKQDFVFDGVNAAQTIFTTSRNHASPVSSWSWLTSRSTHAFVSPTTAG